MFGIGVSELIVIGIILVVAVGPNRMPGLLKAVVRAYREFRRATRELRASTGIDEILEDEELKSLRKPLYVPPAAKVVAAGKPAAKRRSLTYAERTQESPPEGVDLAEARERASRPSEEEAARIRAEKEARASVSDEEIIAAKNRAAAERDPADDDAIIAAKHRAAAELGDEDADAIRRAKIAAAEAAPAGDDEVRRAKIAAASEPDADDGERVRRGKIAGA